MTDTYELPELPPFKFVVEPKESHKPLDVYTPDQMREYARLAVKAERERAARIAEGSYVDGDSERGIVAQEIAAAIRQGAPS